jgi:hypothetical protein
MHDPRRNVIITLSREEFRTLCIMLGYACASADERKREDARDWLQLTNHLTREISGYIEYGYRLPEGPAKTSDR